MEPIKQIKLDSLMAISKGDSRIAIGLIDGPIELNHSAFQDSEIKTVREKQLASCANASSIACTHGTFVAGILSARRGSDAPAICPGCKIILYPFLAEQISDNKTDNSLPYATPQNCLML